MSIVTPEAVPLEFELAGVGSRMLALSLDLAVQLLALLALAVVAGLGAASGLPESASAVITVVALFLIVLGYPVLSETFWSGRTVGKAAVGLRVRTTEGAPIRFRHAAIRGALGLVDFWLTSGVAATLSVLLTRDSQRLGDLAAGTVVCHGDARRRRERVPEADPLAPSAPLDAAESRAIVAWAARAEQFTPARARELSDLLAPLTRTSGEEGQRRLVRIANWVVGRR